MNKCIPQCNNDYYKALKLCLNHIEPSAFCNCYDIYSLQQLIVCELNKIIDNQIWLYNELKCLIENFDSFKKFILSSALPNFIREILNEWRDNGYIEDIINESLLAQLEHFDTPKNNDLSTNMLMQFEYETSVPSGTPKYHYPQGFVYINGNIVYALVVTSTYGWGYDTVKLVEKSLATGTTLREAIVNGGHANSLTYNKKDNIIYIARSSWTAADGTSYEDGRITEINYDDFSEISTWGVNVDSSCPYPEIKVHNLAYDNNLNVLWISNNKMFYKVDTETHLSSVGIPFQFPNVQGLASQDLEYWNGYLLFTKAFPNQLMIFNSLNGELVKRYTNVFTQNDIYTAGEWEGLSLTKDSHFLISTAYHTSTYNIDTIIGIIEFDLVENTHSKYYNHITSNVATASRTFYVDINSTNLQQDGSPQNPFHNLQNACNAVMFGEIHSCQIEIVRGGSYPPLYLNKISKTIIINNSSGSTVTIQGCQIYQCNQVILNNLNFTQLLYNNNSSTCVRISMSKVLFQECDINANNSVNYCLYILENSDVYYQGVVLNNAIIRGCLIRRSRMQGNLTTTSMTNSLIELSTDSIYNFNYPRSLSNTNPSNSNIIYSDSRASTHPSCIKAIDTLTESTALYTGNINFLRNNTYFNTIIIETTLNNVRQQHYNVLRLSDASTGTQTLNIFASNIVNTLSSPTYKFDNELTCVINQNNNSLSISSNISGKVNIDGTITRETYDNRSVIDQSGFQGITNIWFAKI